MTKGLWLFLAIYAAEAVAIAIVRRADKDLHNSSPVRNRPS